MGINELNLSDHIRIYPNPAKGMIRIDVDVISGTTSATLLTTLGKILRNFTMPEPVNGTSTVNLNLTALPKGVYLVRFNNTSFTHIQKLVIE